jgi:hypothetical protein
MPIPNHCAECDKPLNVDAEGWVCQPCMDKEKEKQKMVTSNNTGEPMNHLSSSNESKNNTVRR